EESSDVELEHNGKVHPTTGRVTDVLTDEAISFMARESEAGKPFFCFLPYPATHSSDSAADPLFDKYRARDLDPNTAAAYAEFETLDSNVGRLVQWLDSRKLLDQTILWFLSDNGPALAPDDASGRFNGHLRGGKGSVHEGGVRAPSFVVWPGKIPPDSKFRRITAHIDILPTLLDLCQASAVRNTWIDGMSLSPALLTGGQPERWPNRILFTSWTPPGYDVRNASVAVRTDRWLALRDPRWRRTPPSETHSGWELYDLNADPHEWTDLSNDYPFLISDMRADFSRWMDETTDDGLGPVPTEIGHPEWPVVTLRAQDATLTGKWGSSDDTQSLLSNWTDATDEASWPLEVVGEGGAFQIEIEYRAAAANLPCRMRAGWGDKQIDLSITEATDSWKRISIGEIEFAPGEGAFVLRPLEFRGKAIELRQVRLIKTGS
ncbi:MAG: sulfatase-like hydrolase/transferase, partial [Verrucomicrobiae bacterium]|nr:sulfatase-like hydrolase/transferase [Verrucomicrobiae bacterium]